MSQEYANADVSHLANRIVKGDLGLHKLDTFVEGDKNKGAALRRAVLEKITGVRLTHISQTVFDFNQLYGRNIENPIGSAHVPMGVAGPLLVKGEYAKGLFFVPLACSEGALVASVNRGCAAITRSGGAIVRVLRNEMTRAPLFRVNSVEQAVELVQWVRANRRLLEEAVGKVTRHGRLLDVEPYIVGNNVFLRFKFFTGDAMGMNMATIACDEIRKVIEEHLPFAHCISLSGNVCTDKKPAHINAIRGRGKTVVAEAVVNKDVVSKVLKTEPEAVVEVNVRKNYVGSATAGSISFNAHFANIIAAIFIATGQDVAQVVESSIGYTYAEVTEGGDLYISVTLPSLEVGTVGGGTWLPTAREALALMGCAGGGDPVGSNALKFAEVVTAAVLAGELSLLAALAAHHLAEAHKRLGRRKRHG